MNMFYKFFGAQRQIQTVEVPGGKFEFKALSKDTPLKVLWFTKHDIMQSKYGIYCRSRRRAKV